MSGVRIPGLARRVHRANLPRPVNGNRTEGLGAVLGSSDAVNAQFSDTVKKVDRLREAIEILENPQCELVLQRRCVDVSKVTYLLRCNGDRIQKDDYITLVFD